MRICTNRTDQQTTSSTTASTQAFSSLPARGITLPMAYVQIEADEVSAGFITCLLSLILFRRGWRKAPRDCSSIVRDDRHRILGRS